MKGSDLYLVPAREPCAQVFERLLVPVRETLQRSLLSLAPARPLLAADTGLDAIQLFAADGLAAQRAGGRHVHHLDDGEVTRHLTVDQVTGRPRGAS